MSASVKAELALVAGLTAAALLLCPLQSGVPAAAAQSPAIAVQHPDTAVARLHISGMTCGTCPRTARLALRRLAGVYSATVTLDDSLGVVRYDPRQVTPAQIAAHLTRRTGYGARILADTTGTPRSPGRS